MEILLTIPETLTEDLRRDAPAAKATWQRVVLEEAAAALYRAGTLTKTQVMTLLDLETREDFYTFLHAHRIPMTTMDRLHLDRTTSERLSF